MRAFFKLDKILSDFSKRAPLFSIRYIQKILTLSDYPHKYNIY